MRFGGGIRWPARHRLTKWVLAAVVAVALAAMAMFVYANSTSSARTASSESTNVAKVRRGTVTTNEAAAGTVQAANTRGLSFATSGTVTEILVRAGDRVTAGQVLARIDDGDAQDAVSAAESDVSSAQTQLDDAESSSCTVTGAGYHPSPSPTASPTSPAASPSPPSPSASPSTTSPPITSPRAATPGAIPNGGTNPQGATSCGGGPTGDSIYSAQTQLNNAEQKLAEAKRQLAGTVIAAPVDGRVTAVNGTVGTDETPGATAFITLAATGVVVRAQFSEADVAALKVGQPVAITLPGRTTTYSGRVSTISPAGTASGQLIRYAVMIAFDQPPSDLLYGQAANTVVATGTATNVLYVPSSAVTDQSAGTGTVVVREGGRDRTQTVQIGLRGDQYTEIRSGLVEGQTIEE
jgi:HlyD family secretion protein